MKYTSTFDLATARSILLSSLLLVVGLGLTAFTVTYINVQTVNAGTDSQIATDLNQSYFNDNPETGVDITNESVDFDGGQLIAQSDSGNSQATEGQCEYLTENLRIDFNNSTEQVQKLQAFLKSYQYDFVELTGEFDRKTLQAVTAFQAEHADEILEPWGYEADEATGYVYITTRNKINEIYCDREQSLSSAEEAEIRKFRQKLTRWRQQGASFDTPEYLAQYNAQTDSNVDVTGEDLLTDAEINQSDESTNTDDSSSDDPDMTNNTDATNTATATTESTSDDPGFFARLFGAGDDSSTDESESDREDTLATRTSATNTDASDASRQANADDPTEADDTATTATGTAVAGTTSNATTLDQTASGVYTGINSIIDFLLSSTFLLILLAVLILLLIATLLEDVDDDSDGGDPEVIFGGDDENNDDEASDDKSDDDESDESNTDDSAKEDADTTTSTSDADRSDAEQTSTEHAQASQQDPADHARTQAADFEEIQETISKNEDLPYDEVGKTTTKTEPGEDTDD